MREPPILPVEKKSIAPRPVQPVAKSLGLKSLTENKLAVLATLFLVTGALGIPLLWMSSKFSVLERWLWSIVNSVYTAVLIWLVFQICLWSWRRISGF